MLPLPADVVLGPSAWPDTTLELPVFPTERESSVCERLMHTRMADLHHAGAAVFQDAAPGSNARQPVLCDPDAVLQRHFFGQHLEQPTQDVPDPGQCAEVQLPASPVSAHEQWPLLEVPLTGPEPSGATAWARCALELLQRHPPLAVPALPEPDVAGGATFEDRVAPCLVLDDALMLLPLVRLEREPVAAQPDLASHARIVDALRLKPRSLAHLQLVLDWSLADPAAPDPSGRLSRAMQKLRAELEPRDVPMEHDPLPPMLAWPDLVRSLAGDLARVHDSSREKDEELPPALRQRLLDMQRVAVPMSDADAQGASGDAADTTDAHEHRATRVSSPGNAGGQADASACKRKEDAGATIQAGCSEAAVFASKARDPVEQNACKRVRLQAPANRCGILHGSAWCSWTGG